MSVIDQHFLKKTTDQEVQIKIHTLLYIKQITNKDLLYSTGNYIQYLVITYHGGECKKEYVYTHTHTHKYESLCCEPEINTTLQINYISINFFNLKKRKLLNSVPIKCNTIEKSADLLVAIWYVKKTILKCKSNLQNSVQYGSTQLV